VLRHAIHFCLQLLGSNWVVPVILQRLRVAQIIFDLLFQLRLRHHRIQRWLGIGTLFWPDTMTPVNFFKRSLINYALSKGQRSLRNFRRRFRTEESQQASA
jgi:hypothetical protein